MAEISDVTLMAYADGCLAGPEAARIQAEIETSEILRKRLQAFITTSPAGFANIFDAPMDQSIPARLIATVMSEVPGIARDTHRESWFDRIAASLFPLIPASTLGGMVASGAACLALGVMTGWLLHQTPEAGSPAAIVATPSGAMEATGLLRAALESTASSGKITDAEFSVQPELSFRAEKAWCREYVLTSSLGDHFNGVACRNAAGRWIVEAHALMEGPPVLVQPEPAQTSDGDHPKKQLTPATGAESPAAVEGAIDHLKQSDVLTPSEEETLLKNGWKNP